MHSITKSAGRVLLVSAAMALAVVLACPAYAQSTQGTKSQRAAGRLPEDGLRRAQQAEKALAANKPQEAIQVLSQLDKDMPGYPAVSLRLAQIFDQMDNAGAALFYYRRYIAIAGEKAREEATIRVYALELMPDARSEAEEFGQQAGEVTLAAVTPAPVTDWQIAAARDDGSLVPIRDEKELERLTKQGELPESTPVTSAPGPTPIVLSFETPRPKPRQPEQRDVQTQRSGQGEPARRPSQRSVYADGTPGPRDADAALAMAFATGQQLPPENNPIQPAGIEEPDMAEEAVPSLQGLPVSTPSARRTPAPVAYPTNPRAVTRPPAGRTPVPGSVAFTSPTPQTDVVSPRADRFFTVRQSSAGRTTIRLINNLPEAVLTFAALPDDDLAEPINVILAKDETRSVELPPGDYEISANVSTINYPPLTLLDIRFPYTFEPGMQYTRRFSKDTLEQVR